MIHRAVDERGLAIAAHVDLLPRSLARRQRAFG